MVSFQDRLTAAVVAFALGSPLLSNSIMLTQGDLLRELGVDGPAILGAVGGVACAACG